MFMGFLCSEFFFTGNDTWWKGLESTALVKPLCLDKTGTIKGNIFQLSF